MAELINSSSISLSKLSGDAGQTGHATWLFVPNLSSEPAELGSYCETSPS